MANLIAIFELFNTAITSKLQYPKIRLQYEGMNGRVFPVVIKRNGAKSKTPGDLAVSNGAEFNSQDNIYYGRISQDGKWFANSRCQGNVFAVQGLLERLANDPVGVATEYGKLTGNCCFCDKKLTDPQSTAVGYGPICADNWGLPWGKTDMKASNKVVMEPLLVGSTQNFLHEGVDVQAEIRADEAMAQDPVVTSPSVLDQWLQIGMEVKSMSFAPEVIADNSGKWAGNALRFATREEAEANVRDLMGRWMSVRETRVVESTDPINYRWNFETYRIEPVSAQ